MCTIHGSPGAHPAKRKRRRNGNDDKTRERPRVFAAFSGLSPFLLIKFPNRRPSLIIRSPQSLSWFRRSRPRLERFYTRGYNYCRGKGQEVQQSYEVAQLIVEFVLSKGKHMSRVQREEVKFTRLQNVRASVINPGTSTKESAVYQRRVQDENTVASYWYAPRI